MESTEAVARGSVGDRAINLERAPPRWTLLGYLNDCFDVP